MEGPAVEGADVAVWLALRVPEKAASGGFYIDEEKRLNGDRCS